MPLRAKRKMPRSRTRSESIENHGFYPYYKAYLESLLIKGYTRDTADRREDCLYKFVLWCSHNGIHFPGEVSKPVLDRYQRYLYYYKKRDGEPLAFTSQGNLLSAVKGFFSWLVKEQYLTSNPASEIELPKIGKSLPRYIMSIDEVEKIILQPNISEPEGVRDRAILELFYATGIRRMELCNLKIFDLDFRRNTIHIKQGKGGYDRVIPVGPRAMKWIEKYRLEVRPLLAIQPDDGFLFLTDFGEIFNRNTLATKVKQYMNKAGVKVTGSCHLFRHAMATHMLENGADVRFIQSMLGHQALKTTEIYTRVSITKLTEVHQTTHPSLKNVDFFNKLDEEAAEESFESVTP